ncbi:MAG: caspase family protein [Bacteroidales bacterium]|nr:caspase family protein [Bacteroidales bacterium]
MKKIFLTIMILIISLAALFAQEIVPVVQAGHSGAILHVEWDPTSRYIASIDVNNELVINDIISGKMFYRIKIPGDKLVMALNFDSENSLKLATISKTYRFDMQTLELETSSGKMQRKMLSNDFKIHGAVLKKGNKSLFNRDAYSHFTFAANSIDGKSVVAGDERGCVYFCNKNLSLKEFDNTHFLSVNDIDFSADGKFVAIASSDRSISIWSLPDFKFEKRVIPRSFNVSAIISHPNDSLIAFGDELGFVYLLKFENDKVSCQGVNAHNGVVNDICFSPNSNITGTAGSDNMAAIVDFENKTVLQKFRLHPNTAKVKQTFNIQSIQEKVTNEDKDGTWFDENVYSVAISPDGKTIAYSGGKWGLTNPVLKVSSINNLNINKPKEERKPKKVDLGLMSKTNEHIFNQLYFTDDKEFYGLGENQNKAVKFNTAITGYTEKNQTSTNSIFTNKKPNNILTVQEIIKKTSDSDYIIKTNPENEDTYTCKGFEIERKTKGGKTIKFTGHRGYINDFELITEKNYLISSGEDASMIIWNLETGEKLLSIYVVDMGKLIFITPDNYYMATGDALTGLGFNFDSKVFPAEQFDIKYNRPDYVLQSFGYFDQDIVELYHKAYLKRISKLGFTEEMLNGEINLPELKIENLKNIPLKTTSKNISVELSMTDKNYTLDRVNVYVNDVPLFGTKGMSLKIENSKSANKKIDIPLSKGNNTIYISCLNEKGIESLKEELSVNYESSDNSKPDLYLISLAVTDYEQSQYNLRYTINDGKGFIKLFTDNAKNFNKVYVHTFYNENCTRKNVLAVKDELLKSGVDDYVYVHIAGHGLLDDNLDFYFATSDIDFANPSTNGLKYDEIEGLLDGIPARNKLLLMDACHSGEVDKDDDFAVNTVTDGDDTRGVTMFSTKASTTPKTGLRNSFELMRLLFADLKKGTGTVVISAASGGGYALEKEDIENGIFTYCLIEAVSKNKADINKDNNISVSELRNYIFEGVKRLSAGKQQPTSRSENLMNDFRIK